jgi:predicted Zn finger-like uncharacterized protein
MIVTCEACFTQFNLNDESIKPTGTKVRCSKCQKVFKVFPYVAEEIIEEISPQLPTELSDKLPESSLSSSLLEMPSLNEPNASENLSSDLSPEPSAMNDMTGFDFSELEKLLQEDDKDKPEDVFENNKIEKNQIQAAIPTVAEHLQEIELSFDIEKDQTQETLPSFPEHSFRTDISNDFEGLTDFDLSDLSLELPEIKNKKDESYPKSLTSDIPETMESNLPSDKSDESLELALSELSLDEIFADVEKKHADTDLKKETKEKPVNDLDIQEFSLDDIENSLEMDLTNLSLDSQSEIETAHEKKSDSYETAITSDQKQKTEPLSDDTLMNLDDIQALDLSDLENLLEKQDAANASPMINVAENFPRTEPIMVPPTTDISTEPELKLEMEDHFLTFDELQLDTDGSKSDTIQERKESFQPPLPEVSQPPPAPSIEEKPIVPKPVSEDREKEILIHTDIDQQMEDTTPEPKKGINLAILITLILALISLVSYGGYLLLNSMGIAIPFISKPAPKVSDPGNINIKPFEVSGKFVSNEKIGNLFVITGNVKNGYPTARSFIQVVGKIYTKDNKTPVKTETNYCGNILSDTDLAVADAAMLKQRLQNRSGDNGINQKVQPGNAIPFMIVFSNLPPNLEEFTAEVTRSDAS